MGLIFRTIAILAFMFALSGTGLCANLEWSGLLGGDNTDDAAHVSLDLDGNIIVAGTTRSIDLPTTPGAFQTAAAGWTDIWVAKIDPDLTNLIWCTYVGGPGFETLCDMSVSSDGYIALCGRTTGLYPTTEDAMVPSAPGSFDGFVSVIAPDGSSLSGSTLLGSPNSTCYGVDFAADGPVIVAGVTGSTFPSTAGSYSPGFNGGNFDGFVAKIRRTGDAMVWATYVGGGDDEACYDVTVLDTGLIVAGGYSSSQDLPVTPGNQSYSGGICDGFLWALDSTGAQLIWSNYLGGDQGDKIWLLARAPAGDVAVGGWTDSQIGLATRGSFGELRSGNEDHFLGLVSGATGQTVWASYLGGSGDFNGNEDSLEGVACNENGEILAVGRTHSTDFPITPDAVDSTYLPLGYGDAFVSVVSPTGRDLVFSSYLGSDGSDQLSGVCPSGDGGALAVGVTSGEGFPVVGGVFDQGVSGTNDAAMVKLVYRDESPASSPDGGTAPDAVVGVQAYPNPFNPSLQIALAVPVEGAVRVTVQDVKGSIVARVMEEWKEAGSHVVLWEGRDSLGRWAASGPYLVRIEAAGETRVIPVTLLK